MFFSVASPDWKPGQSMAPAGALLFRSRREAEAFAPEAQVVAVVVRHNSAASLVVAGTTSLATGDGWSSRAVANALGGLTVFGSIPAALVKTSVDGPVPVEVGSSRSRGSALADSFGWDSLTMALLA